MEELETLQYIARTYPIDRKALARTERIEREQRELETTLAAIPDTPCTFLTFPKLAAMHPRR